MEQSKRLSLDDFQLDIAESNNEIEKLMGLAAAACHKTCNPQADATYIDWVDYTQEAVQLAEISDLSISPALTLF
ncbi:hypothetical protein SAMN05518672_10726 [Chitinophaga sp. CF118]|uniref:hypothetical protein n=1 Tax=Chitinophaga sp. CF118 TaxID=1884367 RepID=UPI0008E61A8D|nr:hypothetical protein [Chitinophaga sp. CF118]SFE50379.1 hypothetical protein SAMN05518672_10726 [Chitinophaga sp. CF118]